MSGKRSRQNPVFVEERKRQASLADDEFLENVEKIKAFRAVHAHFSEARTPSMIGDKNSYPSNPTLEIRQAMQQAKTSYESIVDIQERLNQAYNEIMRDPS